MTGRTRLTCAAVATWSVLATAALAQQPTFRAGTSVVTVDVSVKRRNAAVAGLAAQDFVLTDNGIRQDVEFVGVDAVPVDVTLVLDQSHRAVHLIGSRLHGALEAVVANLRANDRLAVVLAATDVVEALPMTAPVDWPPGRELAAMVRAEDPGGSSLQAELDASDDPTMRSSWVDGLLFALTRPGELGRRHLVLGVGYMTAGVYDHSILVHSDALAAVAARSSALFEAAQYRPTSVRPTIGLAAFRRQVLVDAAEATGGHVREAYDIVGAVKSILADYRQRYLLRYTVTGVAPEGWHEIAVTTPAFPQYRIDARRGYVGR